MAQGQPGLIVWMSAMAHSVSATDCGNRSGQRDRRHRASQRERRDDGRLAAPRQAHHAVDHRPVMLERRGRIDVGVHARRGVKFVVGEPAGNAHHFHHVFDALGAKRIGMDHLVGQHQLVIQAVEMADRGMDVHRLDRIAAGKMHAVEILGQLDEIAIACGRRSCAPIEIGAVRRRGDIAKNDMVAADRDFPRRIAGCDREGVREQGEPSPSPIRGPS